MGYEFLRVCRFRKVGECLDVAMADKECHLD